MTFPDASTLGRQIVHLNPLYLVWVGLGIFVAYLCASALRREWPSANEAVVAGWSSTTTAYALYGGLKLLAIFMLLNMEELLTVEPPATKPLFAVAMSETEFRLVGFTAAVFGTWLAVAQLRKLLVLARVRRSRLLVPMQALDGILCVDVWARLGDRVYGHDDSIGTMALGKDRYPVFEDNRRGQQAAEKAFRAPLGDGSDTLASRFMAMMGKK